MSKPQKLRLGASDCFEPWIGATFGQGGNSLNGLRLMIVGESHYCPNEPYAVGLCIPTRTRECIDEGAINDLWPYYRRVFYLITGKKASDTSMEDRLKFWNSVTFYSFVPVFVANESRKRPKKWMWQAGYEFFNKIRNEIAPKAILVTGWDLWWYVIDTLPSGARESDTKSDFSWIGEIQGARIKHPSAPGFLMERERSIATELLHRSRAKEVCC